MFYFYFTSLKSVCGRCQTHSKLYEPINKMLLYIVRYIGWRGAKTHANIHIYICICIWFIVCCDWKLANEKEKKTQYSYISLKFIGNKSMIVSLDASSVNNSPPYVVQSLRRFMTAQRPQYMCTWIKTVRLYIFVNCNREWRVWIRSVIDFNWGHNFYVNAVKNTYILSS